MLARGQLGRVQTLFIPTLHLRPRSAGFARIYLLLRGGGDGAGRGSECSQWDTERSGEPAVAILNCFNCVLRLLPAYLALAALQHLARSQIDLDRASVYLRAEWNRVFCADLPDGFRASGSGEARSARCGLIMISVNHSYNQVVAPLPYVLAK